MITIRRFREKDTEPVLDLWDRCDIGRPWLDLRAEITEKRKRDRSLFLVAVEGDVVVGSVMGAYDGRRGWIYHLAVNPELRGQGIGRRLMAKVEEAMRTIGVRKVNLQVRADNIEVVAFYERAGYVDEHLTSMSKWLVPPSPHTTC